jgi:imidazolonepropionase-like amidohydrolase
MQYHRRCGKIATAVLFGSMVAGVEGCEEPPYEVFSGIAIEDVAVVDVVNGQVLPGLTVVIQGNRITAVEPGDRVRLGEAVETIIGTGKYLIPGLWDMHVHAVEEDLEELFLPLFVASGVTGIRDTWGDLDVTRQVRSDAQEGRRAIPKMVVAGNLIDGEEAVWPESNIAATPEAGSALVDSLAAAGAGFIKVYHMLKPEVFFAIAERANEIGIPFVGHVPIGVTASQASDAGMRSVEHASTIFIDCANQPDAPRLQRYLTGWDEVHGAALAEKFRENNTWYVPTLVTERGYTHLNKPEFQNDPRLRFMPSLIQDWWRPENDIFGSDYSDEDWLTAEEGFSNYLDVTALMAEHGVQILAGSDTPNAFAFPGFGLHDELEILVEAGLTPLHALRAATIDAARFLESTDSLGSVEPGKAADLVLLNGNPLEAISNTRKILAVILDGRVLDRTDLDELLFWAEAKAKEPTEG